MVTFSRPFSSGFGAQVGLSLTSLTRSLRSTPLDRFSNRDFQ